MKATADIETLKKEIKQVVKDTIKEELLKLRLELIPLISEREQQEIDRLYYKPSYKTAKSREININFSD